MENIVVQKFGGTSVAKEDGRLRIAEKAIALKKQGKYPVIVVSAMGRKGDPYATDTLIELLTAANQSPSKRELDLVMSCGETISASVLASLISAQGYPAVAMTGFQAGIQTNDNFSDAAVTCVDTGRIIEFLKDDKIVVVTGFQGVTELGDITTLGRGGSDNTAAILGEALNAESIEIYTDVDGVMTADPRIVDDAKVIKAISYADIYCMACEGAKVVDHKAVQVAKRSNRILKIKNTFSDAEGTIICNDHAADAIDSSSVLAAVTSKTDITQFTVMIDAMDPLNERILNTMEENDVSIDLINFFEDRKIFTVNQNMADTLKRILEDANVKYFALDNCAKISVVGHRIHGIPGIMKRIVLTLSKAQIDILQTSDSDASISCLVRREFMEKAVNTLHEAFELN